MSIPKHVLKLMEVNSLLSQLDALDDTKLEEIDEKVQIVQARILTQYGQLVDENFIKELNSLPQKRKGGGDIVQDTHDLAKRCLAFGMQQIKQIFVENKKEGKTDQQISSQKLDLIVATPQLEYINNADVVKYLFEKIDLKNVFAKGFPYITDVLRNYILAALHGRGSDPVVVRNVVSIIIEAGGNPSTALSWFRFSNWFILGVTPNLISFLIFNGAEAEALRNELNSVMASDPDRGRLPKHASCLAAIDQAMKIENRAIVDLLKKLPPGKIELLRKVGIDLDTLGHHIPTELLHLIIQYVGFTREEIFARCLEIEAGGNEAAKK